MKKNHLIFCIYLCIFLFIGLSIDTSFCDANLSAEVDDTNSKLPDDRDGSRNWLERNAIPLSYFLLAYGIIAVALGHYICEHAYD